MKILQMIEMESDGAGRKLLFPFSYPSSVSALSVFLLPFIPMMKATRRPEPLALLCRSYVSHEAGLL